MSKEHRAEKYRGAYTALVTPFDERGEIDYSLFGRLLRFQVENGISGLVIGGTTGEGATLEQAELLDLVEAAVSEVGDEVPIIAGCGSNNTSRAVRLTREVAKRGAKAGLSVVPYYNKPSQEGLFQHFTSIASEGGLPIILYNVPGRTGTNLLPETVARLAENPLIVGIKEASGDLRQIERLISQCPSRFSVISGDDGLTPEIMALGGCGVISVTANILPAAVSEMTDLLLRGDREEAEGIHGRLDPLNRALFIDTNPVPVKGAFEIFGVKVGCPRLPLVPLDPDRYQQLREVLRAFEREFRSSWESTN